MLTTPIARRWPPLDLGLDSRGMEPVQQSATDNLPPAPPLLASCTAALAALGTPGIFDAVFALLRQATPIDAYSALQLFIDKRPRVLAGNEGDLQVDDAQNALTWEAYSAGPYLFDPIHQHFVAGAPSGLYRLEEIAPAGFIGSEFHRRFIANHGHADELDLLVATAQGWAFLLMLVRGPGRPRFTYCEIQALQALLPFVEELLRKHSLVSATALEPERVNDLVQRKIDLTTQYFGASVLTAREHVVLRYLLLGYSSQLIGERLGIAEGTVKIHRRNIHHKLDITSQAELLALFVQCIPLADPDTGADPLVVFQSRPASARLAFASGVPGAKGTT
jgi:DNA-binding CsgD family transcriptional regulator